MDAANVNIEVLESDLGVDSMQRIQDAVRVLVSTLQRAPISNEVLPMHYALYPTQ